MSSAFAGVDVGGHKNTWMAALEDDEGGFRLKSQPRKVRLQDIVEECASGVIAAVTIDAQLALSPADESGFRPADEELQSLLPTECRNWVASFNSLMAVPVRGRLLAEAIAPRVGTILETHPRASLLLGLGDDHKEWMLTYKQKTNESASAYRERKGPQAVIRLWKAWCERYAISAELPKEAVDGELDALVCATVSALYHRVPQELRRLTQGEGQLLGRGPFYVTRRM